MTTETCADCKFFHPFPNTNDQVGQCRAHAPVPVVSRYVTGNSIDEKGAVVQILNGIVDGFFGTTNAKISCGDFKLGLKATVAEVTPEPDAVSGFSSIILSEGHEKKPN